MKKLMTLSFFIILFFLMTTISIIASEIPGLQIDYHDNAALGSLVSEQPNGYNENDQEWRPIYLNDKSTFEMPRPKDLWSIYGYSEYLTENLYKYYYNQSLSGWKNALPGNNNLNWPDDLFISSQKPSSLWQKYNKTLYYQINNQTVQPLTDGFEVESSDNYSFSGTVNSSQLPQYYFQDPIKKMLLENFLMGQADNSNIWSLYDDMAESLSGAGAIHPLGTLIFLAMEYWLIVEYESLVRELEEQSGISSETSVTSSETVYKKYYDPILDKNFILRIDQPNYPMPLDITEELTGFSFLSPEASGSSGLQQKVVSINKNFTSANIPFKYLIQLEEPSSSTSNASSKVRGRFFIRLYYPAPGSEDATLQMSEIEIAGIENEQVLNPWDLISAVHNKTINAKNNTGGDVAIGISDHALPNLALAWGGNIALRAMDFGVDHFEKIEFGIETEIPQGNITGPSQSKPDAFSQAHLSVYPLFFQNIAQAGPWKAISSEASVEYSANTNYLPQSEENEEITTSFQWTIEGEEVSSNETSTFSHTFADSGNYTIWLKVDPEVSSGQYCEIFNDPEDGFSYDICPTWVEETPDLPEGRKLPETINFSINAFTIEDNQILVQWDTSWLMNSRIEWANTLPQTEIEGPTLPFQEKINFGLNTSHEMNISDVLPGQTYYIRISGIPWGNTDNEYLFAENTDSSLGQWWEVIIPDTPEEIIESNESQTTSETSFNLYTYNSATQQLLQINPQTGLAVIMYNLNQKNSFADLSGFSNASSLITVGLKTPDTQLYQINLLTGEIDLIGDTGLNFVEGLEYIPSTGQLFAGGRERPHYSNDSYLFIEINPFDGSIIKQQKTNIGDIDSLAYNPVNGELWAVDNQPNRCVRLWTVNLQTGQGTLRKDFTNKELKGYTGLIGISFSPDGQAYGLLYKESKVPIEGYRLIKIDMNNFSFELLPTENLGQTEILHLSNITCD